MLTSGQRLSIVLGRRSRHAIAFDHRRDSELSSILHLTMAPIEMIRSTPCFLKASADSKHERGSLDMCLVLTMQDLDIW